MLPTLLAQRIRNPLLSPELQAENGVGFFQKLLPALIGLGLLIGTIIFVFILIIGAIQYISSGGDKASTEGARNKMGNAIIGIVILFTVFALINLIEIFFGTNIVSIDLCSIGIGC